MLEAGIFGSRRKFLHETFSLYPPPPIDLADDLELRRVPLVIRCDDQLGLGNLLI